MLILFETSAGYAIFKLLDEKKLHKTENLYKDFETPEGASKVVKLKHFEKFQDTTAALAAVTASVEGKMSKSLKKLLKKLYAKEAHQELAVADAKLGNAIKDKFDLNCLCNTNVAELMRCIRSQMDNLITGLPKQELTAMTLGLAHSLSRYKLKFTPDKVDTMIIQAISLLDDLDKELNNYIMRCREWYGWHFPELGKLISDNLTFVKAVKLIGLRTNTKESDMSDILPEEVEAKIKEAAEISMGTEISDEDIDNISHLCEQVIEISNYRAQLYQYLQHRMMAIAPNVTVLVGELVGARLIAHAGSLLNLAKHPASTVQILGAEKALFRALKTKHDTPKYGLIYHTTLVGHSNAKLKGKMSRMLAAKVSLGCRVDALGESSDTEIGILLRAKLEKRIAYLEQKGLQRISGTGKVRARWEKYDKSQPKQYDVGDDSTLSLFPKKRKFESQEEDQEEQPKKKKFKVELEEELIPVQSAQIKLELEEETPVQETSSKKKKKKIKQEIFSPEEEVPIVEETQDSGKKKKKKKKHETSLQEDDEMLQSTVEPTKKKKKKIKVEQSDDDDE